MESQIYIVDVFGCCPPICKGRLASFFIKNVMECGVGRSSPRAQKSACRHRLPMLVWRAPCLCPVLTPPSQEFTHGESCPFDQASYEGPYASGLQEQLISTWNSISFVLQ